jgi:peptide/nickel transport system permease protein
MARGLLARAAPGRLSRPAGGRRPPAALAFLARPLTRFLVRRVLVGLITLIMVSVLVFAATQALPSDPARAVLGRSATPEGLAALRREFHLDEPVIKQYFDWASGIAHGDLGRSVGEAARRPVTEIIGTRIVNSAVLMLIAALVSIPLAIFLGAVSGLRRDRRFDHATSLVSLVLAAAPEFVVGVALILLFGTGLLHILPPVSLIDPNVPLLDQGDKLVLPALTLILAVTPYVTRMVRASVIEVLESDYIEMARLKGLTPARVLVRHALPNAIVPTIAVTALQFAYLAGGVVVVEYVFGYPGIGSSLVEAVANRDLPTIQAVTLLIGAFYVVVNLIADVATILVSPRLRTAYQA